MSVLVLGSKVSQVHDAVIRSFLRFARPSVGRVDWSVGRLFFRSVDRSIVSINQPDSHSECRSVDWSVSSSIDG